MTPKDESIKIQNIIYWQKVSFFFCFQNKKWIDDVILEVFGNYTVPTLVIRRAPKQQVEYSIDEQRKGVKTTASPDILLLIPFQMSIVQQLLCFHIRSNEIKSRSISKWNPLTYMTRQTSTKMNKSPSRTNVLPLYVSAYSGRYVYCSIHWIVSPSHAVKRGKKWSGNQNPFIICVQLCWQVDILIKE